jgi:4-O-beta-D-mannosyl-D-glucose phosphorylase
MDKRMFGRKVKQLLKDHRTLIDRKNQQVQYGDGLLQRYQNPVLTGQHTPVFWRYDLNYKTNPFLMERIGINSAFNPGAIKLDGKILLIARVEGVDRKSFFAVAESTSGVDRFQFWDYPIQLPETGDPLLGLVRRNGAVSLLV